MKSIICMAALVVVLAMSAFAGDSTDSAKAMKKAVDTTESNLPPGVVSIDTTVLESGDTLVVVLKQSGLKYADLKVGEGPDAALGTKLRCHYTLWFADSTWAKARRVQSSKDGPGKPFMCTLGIGLIPGWTEGMLGMKPGGVRRLWVPSALAYGPAGRPGIPPNQDLIFEIEYVEPAR